jgi:hypothetical protein
VPFKAPCVLSAATAGNFKPANPAKPAFAEVLRIFFLEMVMGFPLLSSDGFV